LDNLSREVEFKTKINEGNFSLKVTKLKNQIYGWKIKFIDSDNINFEDNILETSFDIKFVIGKLQKIFKKVEHKICEDGNRVYVKCIK